MALEVFESSDEQEKKTNKKESKPEIPQEFLQMLSDLQKKVDELEQKGQAPQVGFNGQTIDLASLIRTSSDSQKSGNGPKVADNGQFVFAGAATSFDATDKSDVLDKKDWVTFICHKWFNVITTDLRDGMEVPVPYRPIKFQYDFSISNGRSGKESEINHVSTYTCKSKKELEWLRTYSLYNIEIFDSTKGALSEDAKRAKQLSVAMNSLRGVGAADLRAMAASHPEIENYHDMSPEQLRFTIASVVTEKRRSLEEQLATIRLNETALEAAEIGR